MCFLSIPASSHHTGMDAYLRNQTTQVNLPSASCLAHGVSSVQKEASTLHWVRQLGSDNEPAQLLGLKRLRKKSNSCNLKQYSIRSLPSSAGDLTAAMTLTESTRSRRAGWQRKRGSLPALPQPETRRELADAACNSKLLAGSEQSWLGHSLHWVQN